MILLIDNYDSFSYNLYQYIGEMESDIRVIRNDEMSIEEIRSMNPEKIIISPGPGRPENAGIIIDVIRNFGKEIPILGVCLGHQAICMAYGATITYASRLMHGKQSPVSLEEGCPIFEDIPRMTRVGRYHSLAVDASTLPEELIPCAVTIEGEVMAVRHRDDPVYGLQFHPESILTPCGKTMIKNFLNLKQDGRQ